MTFHERYIHFLSELEKINESNEELTDTDVRERLWGVLNYYFVWGNPIEEDFPQRFSMLLLREIDCFAKPFVVSLLMLLIGPRWRELLLVRVGTHFWRMKRRLHQMVTGTGFSWVSVMMYCL